MGRVVEELADNSAFLNANPPFSNNPSPCPLSLTANEYNPFEHRSNFLHGKSGSIILQYSRIESNSSVVALNEGYSVLAEISGLVSISGPYCCERSRRRG